MHRFLARFRVRTPCPTERITFCDSCGEVCTPDCRRNALQASKEQIYLSAGLRRF